LIIRFMISASSKTTGNPPPSVPGVLAGSGYRLLTRERTTAVTVSPNRVLVETTVYRHWADFCDRWVRLALTSVGDQLGAISGLDRAGLRFINEIRTSLPSDDITGWRRYISAGLLAPTELAGDQAIRTVQLALHLDEGEGAELLMRAGLLNGRIVDDSGPLRLPRPVQDGRFFMIDIDSFWNRPATYEEWSVDHAIGIAKRLHDPVDDLFERCITEELREDVLRRQP
jgi:uncharacterized protein (TIGR04255 family)